MRRIHYFQVINSDLTEKYKKRDTDVVCPTGIELLSFEYIFVLAEHGCRKSTKKRRRIPKGDCVQR